VDDHTLRWMTWDTSGHGAMFAWGVSSPCISAHSENQSRIRRRVRLAGVPFRRVDGHQRIVLHRRYAGDPTDWRSCLRGFGPSEACPQPDLLGFGCDRHRIWRSVPERRMRRLRRTPALRAMVAEHHLSPSDLIAPLSSAKGSTNRSPSLRLPGVLQHTVSSSSKSEAVGGGGYSGDRAVGVPASKDAVGSGL